MYSLTSWDFRKGLDSPILKKSWIKSWIKYNDKLINMYLILLESVLASRPVWYYSCTKERVWQTKITGLNLGLCFFFFLFFFFLIFCINCSKCREKLHCLLTKGQISSVHVISLERPTWNLFVMSLGDDKSLVFQQIAWKQNVPFSVVLFKCVLLWTTFLFR